MAYTFAFLRRRENIIADDKRDKFEFIKFHILWMKDKKLITIELKIIGDL